MKKNKALFISHSDDNSGAPKALYNILNFILITYGLNVDIYLCVSKNAGIFENLKKENNTNLNNIFYSKKQNNNKIIRGITSFIEKNFFFNKRVKKYNKEYDFVFFNSISFNYFKFELDGILIPKYLYLHEGSNILSNILMDDYSIFNKFDHVFVPSKQVEVDLINHGVCEKKITILQLFLDEDEIIDKSSLTLASDKDKFVVGNLANLTWIKGAEYFLATAKLYKELHPDDDIKFIWKGCVKDSFSYKLIKFEIQNANLNDIVIFEEYSKDINDFLLTIDVFLMTSKEETFGFVILEAANCFKPSIAFKNVVGASEFINKYGGFTVEYLSIYQLVGCLKKYYENRDLINSHGIKANHHLIGNYTLNEKLKKDLKSKLEFILD